MPSYNWRTDARSNLATGDENNARRCLEHAQAEALTSKDYRECARLWHVNFNETQQATSCMQQAGNCPQTERDRRGCAYIWQRVFGDEARARECWPDVPANIPSMRVFIRSAEECLRLADPVAALSSFDELEHADCVNAARDLEGWLRGRGLAAPEVQRFLGRLQPHYEVQSFLGRLQPSNLRIAFRYALVWLCVGRNLKAEAKQFFASIEPASFVDAIEHARIWLKYFGDRPRAETSLELSGNRPATPWGGRDSSCRCTGRADLLS